MIPKSSEAIIRHHAIAQFFDRGQVYDRSGSVYSLVQNGHTLSARVKGNEAEAYRINLNFDK